MAEPGVSVAGAMTSPDGSSLTDAVVCVAELLQPESTVSAAIKKPAKPAWFFIIMILGFDAVFIQTVILRAGRRYVNGMAYCNAASRHEKPQPETGWGFSIGGAGGSRTPVRKYSAVGTTCLGPSLALATQRRTGTMKSSEPIIGLAIQCKGDLSRDPVSVAPAQTHRHIRNGAVRTTKP